MKWNVVAGNWAQFKGNVREKLGELNENDVVILAGRHDQLLGMIQIKCDLKPLEAAKELQERGVLKWEGIQRCNRT